MKSRTDEVPQQVKAFATKPASLNSVLGIRMVGKDLTPTNHPKSSTRAPWPVCTHTSEYNKYGKRRKPTWREEDYCQSIIT